MRCELRGDEDLYTAMLNDLILNHTLNFIAKETKNKEKVALKMFLLFRLMAILKFWECNLTGLINYVKGMHNQKSQCNASFVFIIIYLTLLL